MNLDLLRLLFGLGLLRMDLMSWLGNTFLLVDLGWLSLVMLRLGLRLLWLYFLRTILLGQLHGRLSNILQLFLLYDGLLRVGSGLLRRGLSLNDNLSCLSRMGSLLDYLSLNVLLVHYYLLGLVGGGSTLILGHYDLVALNYLGLGLVLNGVPLGNGDLHVLRYSLPFWFDLSCGDLDLMNSVILLLMVGLLEIEDDGGTRRSAVLLNHLLFMLDMGDLVGDVVGMRGR